MRKNAEKSSDKASLGVGLAGAVLGSVCCLLPALALAVGFGGVAGPVQLGRYQPYLLAVSLLFVVGMNWYLVQRRLRCCTVAPRPPLSPRHHDSGYLPNARLP